jgi:uncharacterized membrane protein YfcA
MLTSAHDLWAVASGGLVGLILGVVGGGGSIIAVPLLLYLVGVPSVHAAIGTSALAVALSAFGNLLAAARRGLVKWPCALVFSAAGIAGSYGGSQLALLMPGAKVLALFGGLMMAIGTVMLLRKDAEGDPDVRLTIKTARHMLPWLLSIGLVVGALAGFFGIGGGFLIVPGLILATGMPITSAIATSLVAIAAFGAVTASSYAIAGEVVWRTVGLFVAGGIAGSIVGQFAGGKLAHHKAPLQTIFAAFVIAIGAFTIYKGLP